MHRYSGDIIFVNNITTVALVRCDWLKTPDVCPECLLWLRYRSRISHEPANRYNNTTINKLGRFEDIKVLIANADHLAGQRRVNFFQPTLTLPRFAKPVASIFWEIS
jgi:hypothetical protein